MYVPSVNSEFMLHADDVHVTDVEKAGGAQIGRQVLLLVLEANHLRVFLAVGEVIDRYGKAFGVWMRARDGGEKVGGERSNAALARQMVAYEGDFADFGFLHNVFQSLSARTINLSGAAPTK